MGRVLAVILPHEDDRLVRERERQTFDVPEVAADPFQFPVECHGTVEIATAARFESLTSPFLSLGDAAPPVLRRFRHQSQGIYLDILQAIGSLNI